MPETKTFELTVDEWHYLLGHLYEKLHDLEKDYGWGYLSDERFNHHKEQFDAILNKLTGGEHSAVNCNKNEAKKEAISG